MGASGGFEKGKGLKTVVKMTRHPSVPAASMLLLWKSCCVTQSKGTHGSIKNDTK